MFPLPVFSGNCTSCIKIGWNTRRCSAAVRLEPHISCGLCGCSNLLTRAPKWKPWWSPTITHMQSKQCVPGIKCPVIIKYKLIHFERATDNGITQSVMDITQSWTFTFLTLALLLQPKMSINTCKGEDTLETNCESSVLRSLQIACLSTNIVEINNLQHSPIVYMTLHQAMLNFCLYL